MRFYFIRDVSSTVQNCYCTIPRPRAGYGTGTCKSLRVPAHSHCTSTRTIAGFYSTSTSIEIYTVRDYRTSNGTSTRVHDRAGIIRYDTNKYRLQTASIINIFSQTVPGTEPYGIFETQIESKSKTYKSPKIKSSWAGRGQRGRAGRAGGAGNPITCFVLVR